MNKLFYLRLAISNIRNNKTIYLPYLLASSLIVMLFYGLRSVSYMVIQSGASGSGTMSAILNLSSWICGILALIILFYVNSFIMKRRKKEFGLYSILGMEKRHISMVMIWEVLLTGLTSILSGILFGALFSQLLFLLLLNIVGLPAALVFQIPMSAILVTVPLFGAGFGLLLIYDVISILRTDPIALLRSAKEGEREPKSKWLIALIGLLTLLAGYALSWTVQTASDAVTVFFPAVLLVMIGTYGLFLSGSIVLLKLLRKKKNFYYKPNNFISVSGMMYRMKQNATGLANICILSTCVLVTLSSTVCLFLGEEDILRAQYPRAVKTSCIMTDEQSGNILMQAAQEHAEQYGVSIENDLGYADFSYPANLSKEGFHAAVQYGNDTYAMDVLLLSDYNRICGTNLTLKQGEVFLGSNTSKAWGDQLVLDGQEYAIKGTVEFPDFIQMFAGGYAAVVILPAYSDLFDLQTRVNASIPGEGTREIMFYYDHDVAGQNLEEYDRTMRADLLKSVDRLAQVSSIDSSRSDFYQIYGSILFVGIFFVTQFLIAAVLIIYYKQITEGFDDHDRFRIMQNVGMSDREVKKTISKQVLMVFFLPLGMALLHIIVAFPVLCKLLLAFQMTNQTLFLLCTICVVSVFAVFYFIIYYLTSKTYYRIVQAK